MAIVKNPYTKITDIYLCHVPWDNTYNNVYLPNEKTFNKRKEKALQYFETVKSDGVHFDAVRPVRDAYGITLPIKFAEAKTYNYVIYKDNDPLFSDGEGKSVEHYCFIDEYVRVNDRLTFLKLSDDIFTMYFTMCHTEFQGKTFVKRKHVNKDKIGMWREPESFVPERYVTASSEMMDALYWNDSEQQYYSLGEYMGHNNVVCIFCDNATPAASYQYEVYSDTGDAYLASEAVFIRDASFNGQNMNGMQVIICGQDVPIDTIQDVVHCFDGDASASQVISIKILPRHSVEQWLTDYSDSNTIGDAESKRVDLYFSGRAIQDFQGYQPKNAYLLQYPYLYITVDDMQGNHQDFKVEDFKNLDVLFSAYMDVSPNATVTLVPCNYEIAPASGDHGYTPNWAYKMTMLDLPNGSWFTDTYKAWLAQQGGYDAIIKQNNLSNQIISTNETAQIAQANASIKQNEANLNLSQTQQRTNVGYQLTQGISSFINRNSSTSVGRFLSSASSAIGGMFASGSAVGSAVTGNLLGEAQRAQYETAQGNIQFANEATRASIDAISANSNAQQQLNTMMMQNTLKGAQTMNDGANIATSNNNSAHNMLGFRAQMNTISLKDAKCLDHYLNIFGYPINEYISIEESCLPLIGRREWNYLQTQNCIIKTASDETRRVSDLDLQVLQEIFNNGVRVWHNNPNVNMLNTNLDNSIMSSMNLHDGVLRYEGSDF